MECRRESVRVSICQGSRYLTTFVSRDHPSTIKKRFFSVSCVMLVSPLFVYLFSSPSLFKIFTIWEVMGLRAGGILSAFVIPLLLTMILFLGPLSVQLTNGIWKIYSGLIKFIKTLRTKILMKYLQSQCSGSITAKISCGFVITLSHRYLKSSRFVPVCCRYFCRVSRP